MNDIEIRPITDVPGLRTVEELQRTVWGMPDRDVVPYHQLLAASSAGGAVLGAFTVDGRLIGFCYGFVGLREGEFFFYSHMAGVHEEYRNRDVGVRLKRAQRQFVLDGGLDRMVWTFDPLMSGNASFNLRKLGAVARRYHVDYYGEMPDALNRGMPSDRLEVDWWLRDPRVESLMRGDQPSRAWHDITPVLLAVPQAIGVTPGDAVLEATAPILRLEIPTAFTQIKDHDLGLAKAWRMATRRAFMHYFRREYAAVDFLAEDPQRRVGSYILLRQPGAGPGSSGEGKGG